MAIMLAPLMPRISRQHAMIEMLRARAPRAVTGVSLADSLDVTLRTVERDVAELVDAGVPIVRRRGPGGGYSFDARSTLPPLSLTPGEAAVLVVTLSSIGPGTSAAAQSAMEKLLEALGGEE